MISSIVILGSGNLATHFARACHDAGLSVKQVFSRNPETGNALALACKSQYIDDISHLLMGADAYFFIMNDTANIDTIKLMPKDDKAIYLHTAGSQDISIFKEKFKKFGAFYPFLSFSKHVDLDFSKVPICIEASDTNVNDTLHNLAAMLKCMSYDLDSEQRKVLHLSGVFANNFMNHCVYLGENLLKEANVDICLMQPLLSQGFEKILRNGACKSQTGPAIRADQKTIDKHLEYLKDNTILETVYKSLSDSINKTYNN